VREQYRLLRALKRAEIAPTTAGLNLPASETTARAHGFGSGFRAWSVFKYGPRIAMSVAAPCAALVPPPRHRRSSVRPVRYAVSLVAVGLWLPLR